MIKERFRSDKIFKAKKENSNFQQPQAESASFNQSTSEVDQKIPETAKSEEKFILKGYRIVGLSQGGAIPDEIGKERHFSDTLLRAELWEKAIMSPDGLLYQYYEANLHNGYAILEVEAENPRKDEKSIEGPEGNDWIGKIVSQKPIKVVKYLIPEPSYPSYFFSKKLMCFLGKHSFYPEKGKDEYDYRTRKLTKLRICWICQKHFQEEKNF